MPSLTPCLATLALLFTVGIAFAGAIGDYVELNATHQAGDPFRQEPRGTHDFQRIPDGHASASHRGRKGRAVAEMIIVRWPHRLGDIALRQGLWSQEPINWNLPRSAEAPAHRARHGRARG
jgi:hypothetical protein